MRERSPDLPEWIGSDRAGETFVSISYVWLTSNKPGKAIRIVCLSNLDSSGRIKFGGLEIKPADLTSENSFPVQKGKCSYLKESDALYLIKHFGVSQENIHTAPFLTMFATPALKNVLFSHLIGRFKYENELLKPIGDGDGEVELLSKRYTALVEWGDASPALSLSFASGKPVMDIHNQLKIARRRGYLRSTGQGSRGAQMLHSI